MFYTKPDNELLDRNMSLIANSLLLYNKYALDDNLIDQSVISVRLDTCLASHHRYYRLIETKQLFICKISIHEYH